MNPEKLAELRKAGFTERALDFPRDELALRMLCAFNGVAFEDAPPGWHYFPNEATRDAWRRVADVAAASLRSLASRGGE